MLWRENMVSERLLVVKGIVVGVTRFIEGSGALYQHFKKNLLRAQSVNKWHQRMLIYPKLMWKTLKRI